MTKTLRGEASIIGTFIVRKPKLQSEEDEEGEDGEVADVKVERANTMTEEKAEEEVQHQIEKDENE